MKVFSIARGFYRLSKHAPPELNQKEFDRLRGLTIYRETGDVKLACQTFGISRATLYRWLKRFDPRDLNSLKEQSRQPPEGSEAFVVSGAGSGGQGVKAGVSPVGEG